MKVIGFTGNYGMEDMLPQTYLMAVSSILYSGRPLFVPDFAREFVARPTMLSLHIATGMPSQQASPSRPVAAMPRCFMGWIAPLMARQSWAIGSVAIVSPTCCMSLSR